MRRGDNNGTGSGFAWENARHRTKRAVVWALGTLLKVTGVFVILAGLLTIALSNMDGTPLHDLIWGTILTCAGLVIVYAGFNLAKKAKQI